MGKITIILLVSLVAMVAAKPYENSRKSSSHPQDRSYPYEINRLYESDPADFLDRLFSRRSEDSYAGAAYSPFVALPDELYGQDDSEDRLLKLLDPQERSLYGEQPKQSFQAEEDAEPNQKPEQQKDAPLEEQKQDEHEKQSHGASVDNEHQQRKEEDKKQNEEQDEAREEDRHVKNRQPSRPDHSAFGRPNKPQHGERDVPKRELRRGPPSQPRKASGPNPQEPSGAEPSPQPKAPLVQINVNVAQPAL